MAGDHVGQEGLQDIRLVLDRPTVANAVALDVQLQQRGARQTNHAIQRVSGRCVPSWLVAVLIHMRDVLGNSSRAVDGNTATNEPADPYTPGNAPLGSSCTHTDIDSPPWWSVDLQEPYLISSVLLTAGVGASGTPGGSDNGATADGTVSVMAK